MQSVKLVEIGFCSRIFVESSIEAVKYDILVILKTGLRVAININFKKDEIFLVCLKKKVLYPKIVQNNLDI